MQCKLPHLEMHMLRVASAILHTLPTVRAIVLAVRVRGVHIFISQTINAKSWPKVAFS